MTAVASARVLPVLFHPSGDSGTFVVGGLYLLDHRWTRWDDQSASAGAVLLDSLSPETRRGLSLCSA